MTKKLLMFVLLAMPLWGQNWSFPGPVNLTTANEFCSAASGNSTTYSCNLSPAISGYVTGTHYRFMADVANTAASTINFNAVGAVTIKKAVGGITTDLAANDLRAGQWVDLIFDGTNMQMQSTLGNAPSVPITAIQNGGTTVTPSSGAVNFAPGTNVTLTTSGNTVTVAATGGASPAGSSGSVQTNNGSGGFGAWTDYTPSTDTLAITNETVSVTARVPENGTARAAVGGPAAPGGTDRR